MDMFFLIILSLFHLQGYSSFNDTPNLVKEQTKNIVSGTEVYVCVCVCVCVCIYIYIYVCVYI